MSPMGIIEKCAVTINERVDSLVEHMSDQAGLKRRGKLSTARVLNAMHRPKDLFDSVENDAITWLFALMICREAAVIGRMPILRRKNKIEASLQFIGEGDDFVTVRHR